MMTMEPIHPGEHLSEILEDLGISQYRLAKAINVPPVRVNGIVRRRRAITADTALRLGRVLDITPEFWMNLQQRYDLEVALAGTDVSGMERLVDVEPVVVVNEGFERSELDSLGQVSR